MDINATTFIKNASTTAEHFGFRSVDHLKKHPACQSCATKLGNGATAQDKRNDALHGLLTSGLQTYCDAKLHEINEPLLFYSLDEVPKTGEIALGLHIYNVDKSIAEATLIQTTRALADDLGFQNSRVRINSLGDRESVTRYARELTNYLKKRLDEMPEVARELMKQHAMVALTHLIEKEHDLAYRSPNPLEYLSDQSRKHFREIVEFLDMADVHYEIDPKLIGHHECYSDAMFALDLLDDDQSPLQNAPLLVRGGRYNEFINRATKKNVQAAGAVVVLRDKKAPARHPKANLQDPSVYVVHLGFGPKIKSLVLIDTLRKAGVAVHQNLASDSLSAQLRDAENRGVKHVIIMGQKEFVENSVILRDMEARNQEQVHLDLLPHKLKKTQDRAAAKTAASAKA
jgi:histidyl-tRNA synthetase